MTLIAAIITAVLIPLIKNKLGEIKWSRFCKFVEDFAKSAEQLYTESGGGSKKLEYVLNLASEKAAELKLDITPEVLRAITEARVYELNNDDINYIEPLRGEEVSADE